MKKLVLVLLFLLLISGCNQSNKQDETKYQELAKYAQENNIEIYKISSVTGEGIEKLLTRVVEELKVLPKEELTEVEERVVYTLKEEEPAWTIRKENDAFVIEGKAVKKEFRNAVKKAGIKDAYSICEFLLEFVSDETKKSFNQMENEASSEKALLSWLINYAEVDELKAAIEAAGEKIK